MGRDQNTRIFVKNIVVVHVINVSSELPDFLHVRFEVKLRQFKWATINLFSKDGVQVIYSDANTPVEHTYACHNDLYDLPHDETVVYVSGFSPGLAGEQEATAFCKERGLVVV